MESALRHEASNSELKSLELNSLQGIVPEGSSVSEAPNASYCAVHYASELSAVVGGAPFA